MEFISEQQLFDGIVEPSDFEKEKQLKKRKYEEVFRNLCQEDIVRLNHLEYVKNCRKAIEARKFKKRKTADLPKFEENDFIWSKLITEKSQNKGFIAKDISDALKYLSNMKVQRGYETYLRTLGDLEVERHISTLSEYKFFRKLELEGIIRESGIWGLYIRVKESTTETWSTKTTFIRTIWLALGKSKIHLK
jgi:hypothetical protein